jgi:hypothetical protein
MSAAEEAIRRSGIPGRWTGGKTVLRGWVCPVCGAGVAPWVREHCESKKEPSGENPDL